MKKLSLLTILLSLILANGIGTKAVAKNRPHPRYKKVVVVRPVTPHISVYKPVKLRAGYVWINGYWQWNRRAHKYIWIKGHITKRKAGKVWIAGHWQHVRGGWIYQPGFWA